ncbi:MAG: MATE family efflux transporter [Clostridia bacterium]|nr:MATE family efflux transporter [Clostridia bacterium]
MQNVKENKMGYMPIPKLVLTMSLPMIISMMVQALYNVVDSVFVSRVSEQALTAVSLCFPAQNLMIGLATGTGVGVNALLSRALGAGDRERANKVAENGVLLAMVGFVIFFIFGLVGSRPFLRAQTGIDTIIDYGVDYLTVVCCCSFGIFGQIMFERLMQATGRTIYTMFTQGTGAIINLILDPIFIFKLNMGVRGAAIATVIGQICAFIFAAIMNKAKNHDIELHLRGFRPDGKLIKEIYIIGIPSVIMMAIGSLMTFLMNIILITYTAGRETAATVFGVYFKLNSFVFMPVFGLNNGIIPIIAFNYGAKNRKRMLEAVKVGVGVALCFMLLGSILFETIPGSLLKLFDADAAMLAIGIPALRIIGVHFCIAAICIVLGTVFQALGYSIYSMIVSIARQLVVLIPVAWLLARYGQSVGNDNYVWFSFLIAELMSLVATLVFFRKLNRDVISKVPEGK